MFTRIALITIAATSALIAGLAHAGDPAGKFAVRGAGLIDCRVYVEEREQASPAYVMMGGWMDGYLTALKSAERQYLRPHAVPID